ncbi:hypothetical protein NDU88_001840 [Pleurodeles waltl]|uniref:Uncharacterized protein n=1 Tax=Pleurodeles waltl TaxID=8319 RepID=A0AAV7KTX2_PLEWA|nr:hypothetical protein NDU88_001840 [Pleurodeles waltl]
MGIGPHPLLSFQVRRSFSGGPDGSTGAPPRSPGLAVQSRGSAAAVSRGPLSPPLPRPAFSREAVASNGGRGRRPPLGPGGPTQHTASPGSVAEAQPHRPPVSRTALSFGVRSARAGAPDQSSPAGSSGAGSLGVRHVPALGHAPQPHMLF